MATTKWKYCNDYAIWESENHERKVFSHEWQVCGAKRSHEWQVGNDFSQVRYFTILGFSDGRIDITAI
jgi:hypothetical protein